MLIGMLFDIAPVLKPIFYSFNGEGYYMVFCFSFSAFLFVLHLICLENEMLMNSDYLYEAFLLWQTPLLLRLLSARLLHFGGRKPRSKHNNANCHLV